MGFYVFTLSCPSIERCNFRSARFLESIICAFFVTRGRMSTQSTRNLLLQRCFVGQLTNIVMHLRKSPSGWYHKNPCVVTPCLWRSKYCIAMHSGISSSSVWTLRREKKRLSVQQKVVVKTNWIDLCPAALKKSCISATFFFFFGAMAP